MKIFIVITLSSFLLGILLGYQIGDSPDLSPSGSSTKEATPAENLSSLEVEDDEDLVQKIIDLEKQNEVLMNSLQESEMSSRGLMSEADFKHELFQSRLQKEKPKKGQRRNRGGNNRLLESLNLTSDQAQIVGDLQEKLNMKRSIIEAARDIYTEDELRSMYPELMDFDYRNEMRNILSTDQKELIAETQKKAIDQRSTQVSDRLMERYAFSEDGGFTQEQNDQIREALKKTSSRNLEVPAPIRKLPISQTEKRILAASYENLPPELFEQVYKKITGDKN